MVGDIFQPTHLLFVLVVALLVLGPKRLPEVGRTLGSGIRDFRQALSGESHDPPQHQDAEQVADTTELRHEPAVVAENDISWPEEAVGPTSFDEPVEAASAEPATAVVTDPEPVDNAADDPADAEEAPEPALAAEAHSGSAPAHGEAAGGKLSFYERALARQVSESGGDSP